VPETRAERLAGRLRLFVALELPQAAREALGAWTDLLLGDDPSCRLVAADALHVTLAFLGDREESDVDRIAGATLDAAAGLPAPFLKPVELVGLPPRRPRVLAVDIEDRSGRAVAVQSAVERALVSEGLHSAERRAFRPHVTVARVRRAERAPTGRFPDPPATGFTAAEVVLYRSDLGPDGARYTALARGSLGDPEP
jgi:2'-5' RNA ligase